MDESGIAGFSNVLDGKRALVMGGGGGGIGRAITRGLAAAGSAVGVADVDQQRADEAAAEAAAAGVKAVSLRGDVRARGVIDDLVRRAAGELGGLDILVTVVGGQLAFVPATPIHETTDEDWDLMFDLNLRYVARAVRATLRVFLEQGAGGTIVSIGSITGIAGSPRQAAYGAAKAGLASLARSVAAEYSREGIRHERRHLRPDRNARRPRSSGKRRSRLDTPGSLGLNNRGCRRNGLPCFPALVVHHRPKPGHRRRRHSGRAIPDSTGRDSHPLTRRRRRRRMYQRRLTCR
jgi:3-oxoacyl-[acyl-carrier protein] reductase